MAAYGGNEFSAGVTLAAWLLCEALGAWLAGRSSLASAAPVGQRIVHRLSFLTALSIVSSPGCRAAAVLVRPLLGVLPGRDALHPAPPAGDLRGRIPARRGPRRVVRDGRRPSSRRFPVAELRASDGPPASPSPFPPPQGGGNRREGAKCCTAYAKVSSASSATLPATGSVGSAYVWEGIGTVLAALACFLLLNRLPSLAVVALSALPLIVAVGVGQGRTRTRWTMWTLGFGVLASFVFALPIERMAWGTAWRGQQVGAIVNSPYGKIVRLERAGQQLVLYDGLPVLTVPTTQTERIEELALLPVLLHPAPRRVLVLGSDLTIPAVLARFRPDIKVTTAQLDPILARISFAALSSDSSLLPHLFSLRIADPVLVLGSASDTFDCIILTDATPSSLGASRLFSLEFYQLCRSRLAPGGILATAGPGNPTGLSPDIARILSTRQQTLDAAFEYVLPLAADFPLLLASGRPLNVATETLLSRLSLLSVSPKLLDSSYVASLLDPFRQQAFASQLPARASRHSSASAPRELFLNMVRENRLVSPGFGAFYSRLGNLSSRQLLLLGAVLLIVGLVGARARGLQLSRGFAILTSGFSGAAVSALLIFAWQVRFGSVFSGVALLVAAFMLGTVLGGILGTSPSSANHPSSFIPHPFLVADLVLARCAAAAVVLFHGGPAVVFLVANCTAGACLGFQFAVAGIITHRSSLIASAAARRAGVLTALDLAGGSLGGLLTALVFVPVFGIGTAALCAGAVKLASALVQLMPARPVSQP